MKWKLFGLCVLLLILCSCASPGKFEAELGYDDQGRQVWRIITTKNYGSIHADISTDKNGIITAEIKAEKVDGAVLAAKTIDAQTSIINSLAGLAGLVPVQ